MNFTITITETQGNALNYAAMSAQEWIENFVNVRCNAAIDEIAQVAVAKCLETNTQIPGSKDEMVALAFTNGWVKTAAQRQAESDAAYEAQAAAQLAAQQTPQE